MGVTTGWGGGGRLRELVGERVALRLLAGGESVEMGVAEKVGLVDLVVPSSSIGDGDEGLMRATANFMDKFISDEKFGPVPPRTVRGMKRVMVGNRVKDGMIDLDILRNSPMYTGLVESVEAKGRTASARDFEQKIFAEFWGSQEQQQQVSRFGPKRK